MSKFAQKIEKLKKSLLNRLEEQDIVSVDVASKGSVYIGLLGFRQDDRKAVTLYVRGQNPKKKLYVNLDEVDNYIRVFEFLKKHKEELEKIVGKPPKSTSAPDIDELEEEPDEETEEKSEEKTEKKKKESEDEDEL
ncbi:hypothetical protein AFV1_ORF135 [Captovirus AFV1]|uniref:Uncharacterized protein ORF135 n=1 Tax=Acidianus filamentous virus 1 (isolate United States/Yellowstone) TaxID=654909 RepID=Y135_AFV1Y|nr:hypothetical protein AFV1_ORF135 [Captovirus AFV1]Q70LD7.1 RecName: Full=Uncharacterized protein ORF135 [Acidianus filamentous virus 1 (isolate Yellowstone)]CAD98943.1 hypothetical protein [Captovirus AFV1]